MYIWYMIVTFPLDASVALNTLPNPPSPNRHSFRKFFVAVASSRNVKDFTALSSLWSSSTLLVLSIGSCVLLLLLLLLFCTVKENIKHEIEKQLLQSRILNRYYSRQLNITFESNRAKNKNIVALVVLRMLPFEILQSRFIEKQITMFDSSLLTAPWFLC